MKLLPGVYDRPTGGGEFWDPRWSLLDHSFGDFRPLHISYVGSPSFRDVWRRIYFALFLKALITFMSFIFHLFLLDFMSNCSKIGLWMPPTVVLHTLNMAYKRQLKLHVVIFVKFYYKKLRDLPKNRLQYSPLRLDRRERGSPRTAFARRAVVENQTLSITSRWLSRLQLLPSINSTFNILNIGQSDVPRSRGAR